MPIIVTCPGCKSKLKAPDAALGKRVKCPGCQTAILVQDPGAAAAPAPAPRPQQAAKAPVKKKVEDDEGFDDIDEAPPRKPARGKAVPEDDFEDLEEAPRKPARKGRDEDEDEDDRITRKPAARRGRDEDEDEDEDDRPRSKSKSKSRSGPSGPVSEEEKSNAFLFYIILIAGNFVGIGPIGGLIYWFVKRGDSKFVDYTGKQWINHAITMFLLVSSLVVVLGGIGAVGAFALESWVMGLVCFGLLGLLAFGLGLMDLILFFMAMFKVKAGEWYRFPLSWQLLK